MENEDSLEVSPKKGWLGFLNGLAGSIVYEFIITFALCLGITFFVMSKGVSGDDVTIEVQKVLNSIPYSLIIMLAEYIIVLGIFALIFNFKKLMKILKTIFTWRALKVGLITFLCIIGFEIMYNSMITSIMGASEEGSANQQAVVTMINQNYILGFLAIVILGPIVEELTYRYSIFAIFGGSKKKNRIWAYVVSSIVFAGMHFIASFTSNGSIKEALADFIYLPTYLFSALALCYAYDDHGERKLGNSIVAHILNNLLSFLLIVAVV